METFQLAGGGPAAYEQYLVPQVFDPLAVHLTTLVDPRSDEEGLDVACGTGAVTRRLAAAGARVTGLDLNADMLELARSLEPAATWVEGDAQALPFPAAAFGFVT